MVKLNINTKLANNDTIKGDKYGQYVYRTQIRPLINYEDKIVVELPERATTISSSFAAGLVRELYCRTNGKVDDVLILTSKHTYVDEKLHCEPTLFPEAGMEVLDEDSRNSGGQA